ncbi:alanine racemase [Streptomyces sp. AC555_RSS877]|uniref:alanine racemase n=1 Tax=Streptomyces sp. AC555_RSS877 TaxID=2823688 RepID=UPI001C26A6C2|nr:alanine racemase [Streptomyces sp. AC555_RSS877]
MSLTSATAPTVEASARAQRTNPFHFKSAPGRGLVVADDGIFLFGGALLSPIMLINRGALDHNIAEMAAYSRRHGVLLAPHAKTAMSRELVTRQLQAGAWGASAATVAQVRSLRSFGVANVLLANQLVDTAAIEWVADDLRAHPEHGFMCYVDSAAGAELLDERLTLAGTGVVLPVLLEMAPAKGRAGCRSVAEAVAVARTVAALPGLCLVGLAGYEGVIGCDRASDTTTAVASFCDLLENTAQAIGLEGLFAVERVLISLGGAFFDVVTEHLCARYGTRQDRQLLIRPGGYVSHDHGMYARSSVCAEPSSTFRLRPALELWGRVLSRPEPELAILDFGRRDAPYDQDLPVPQTIRDLDGTAPRPATGCTVTALNDQHAYLSVPRETELVPGQWVGCGISHPCTAFDKWRYLPMVDDDYLTVGAVTTDF